MKNLWAWFSKLFKRQVTEVPVYLVVEVEKPRNEDQLTDEMKASVLTLAAHPGFLYLMAKLKAQRGVLETKLKYTRHEGIRDVEFLQSGIFWTNWLQGQVEKMTLRVERPTMLQPTAEERAAYEEARQLISLVGQ